MPCLFALVLVPFIVPITADPHAPVHFSEYHDNDYSLMPSQDATSDDYAQRTPSAKECACLTRVGSRTGWSFPLMFMINDNGNPIATLHEAPTTHLNIHRDLL
jgi:hypothetical protein